MATDFFQKKIEEINKNNSSSVLTTDIFGNQRNLPTTNITTSQKEDFFSKKIKEIQSGVKEDDRTGLEYTGDLLLDIVTQPVGGVVDAAESIVNLALPKENEIEISGIVPEGKTGIGKFIRPASQFFIPYTGAYKILKGGTLFIKNKGKLKTVLEANEKNLQTALKTGNKVKRTYTKKDGSVTIVQQGSKIKNTGTESLVEAARKSIGKDKIVKPKFKTDTKKVFTPEKFTPIKTVTRGEALGISVGAGALVDAFAFAPEDPNLADLFVQYPSTKFAVFQWLATDPDGDPNMERLKNVLAGLVPSFIIPEVTRGVAKGFNYVSSPAVSAVKKKGSKVLEKEKVIINKELDKAKKTNKKINVKDIADQVASRRTGVEKIAVAFNEKQFIKKAVINLLDSVRGIKYLEDAAKVLNIKNVKGFGPNTKDITAYQEARFLPAVGGMVEHFLLKQTFRFKDGVFVSTEKDGLQQLLAKNLSKEADVDDFFNYVGAKSLQSLKKSDSKAYNNLLNSKSKRDLWNGIAKKGDTKVDYQQTLKELDRFNEDLLQIAKDAQLISQKTMTNLLKKRKPYMPLYRDLSSESLVGLKSGGGNKFLTAKFKVPVGKAEGELPFSNFFDNYIENINGIIGSAYKNHVKRGVFDIIDSGKGSLDEWAVKISPKDKIKLKKITVKPDELKKQINKQDTDIDLNSIDDLDDLTLFRSERVGGLKDNQEFVLRTNEKGETIKDIYEINNPLLYASMQSISPKQYHAANAFVKFGRFWKNLLTRAITYDPGFFAGANFIRDTVSAAILSRNAWHLPFISTAFRLRRRIMSNKPITLKDGTKTTYKKLSQEFFLNGGSFGSTLLKGEIQEAALKSIYRKMGHSDYKNVLNTPRKYMDNYETVVTGFENASRFTEYVLLRKAGRSARQAAFEAREVAVDFGMHGASNAWRQYVSTVPFLNAGLQGLFRTTRALTPGSGQVAATYAKMAAFVGTPTLTMYLINKDNPNYWKQSQQVRDLNFMLPIGDDNWVKIPKPFEFGAVATIAESFLDTVYRTGNADKFFNTAWTVIKAQTRLSVVPQVLSPVINSAFNKTYFGSPIISEGMKHSIPDYGQSYPWSNKAITSAIENAPPWLRDSGLLLSPIEFENLFRAYTGTIGGYFLDLLDTSSELFTETELKDWRADEYPILKRFLSLDPTKYSSYEASFYELKKQTTQAINQAKKFKDEFKFELLEEFLQDKENQELIALHPLLENWSRQVQQLNKKRNQIQNAPNMTGQRKKVMIDEIERQTGLIFDAIMTSLENQNLETFKPNISLQ